MKSHKKKSIFIRLKKNTVTAFRENVKLHYTIEDKIFSYTLKCKRCLKEQPQN